MGRLAAWPPLPFNYSTVFNHFVSVIYASLYDTHFSTILWFLSWADFISCGPPLFRKIQLGKYWCDLESGSSEEEYGRALDLLAVPPTLTALLIEQSIFAGYGARGSRGVGGGGSEESLLREISPCRGAILSSLFLLPNCCGSRNLASMDNCTICLCYSSIS